MTENVSAISYTNKDFQTIYPEILDLATRISERWTPDQSNESDPGIVLAKISAICADKNNYNIDKNILECFPSSVTQMPNAREIYAQRGYYMHWYQSGTGKVSLAWTGDKSSTSSITLRDKFVALTGNDDQIVYTIIPTSKLPIVCDGTSTAFDIIQGVAKEYTTTAGSNVITIEDIDSENRIYFPNTSVAENGIFIKRQDVTEFSVDGWRRVDNLDSHALGQDIYEFGVSRDGSACYIEFPDDVAERIGDGINLWYIATDGLAGNIKPKYLTKFTGTVKGVQITGGGTKEVDLSTDNISFSQADSVSNCKDYESIEEAYRGYKRTIGTFDTLVTLRDYDNALRDSGLVPNGFVTDRTNDIQRSCQIMTEQNDMNVVESHINRTNGTDDMTAFDLCIYAFQYMSTVFDPTTTQGATDYNKTFYMAPNTDGDIKDEVKIVKAYLEDQKSIQHNFVTWGDDKILCIKNKYEVKCQIIPKYSVTSLQANSIKDNIVVALYNALNSSKVEFGEEITYDKVYGIIESADERIKAVSLANIEFTPYASVYDSSSSSSPDKVVDKQLKTLENYKTGQDEEIEIFAKSILAGVTPMFIQDKSIQYSLAQANGTTLENVTSCSTETKISLNQTGTKLLKNESVVFYTPSMVETYQFTLGVKVASSFAIQNDVMTTKIGDNYIDVTFLWKSDNKYYAQRFNGDANNILGIKASISDTIKATDDYSTIFGNLQNGVKTDITNTMPNVVSNWSKFTSISASGTVSVYEQNQRQTESSDRCYWILNNTITDTDSGVQYYQLFDEDAGKDSSYVLDSGEYFIIADSQLVNATVYGVGTKIIRKDANTGKDKQPIRVEVDSGVYKKFVKEGISALANDMISGLDLTLQEREFVVLGEGTTITYTGGITLDNNEKNVTGTVTYQLGDNTSTAQTLPTLSGLTRTARSRLAFNTSDGAMKLEVPRQRIVFPNLPDGVGTNNSIVVSAIMAQIDGKYSNSGGDTVIITQKDNSYNIYVNTSSSLYNTSDSGVALTMDNTGFSGTYDIGDGESQKTCNVSIDRLTTILTIKYEGSVITNVFADKPQYIPSYIQSSPTYNLAGGANTNLTYPIVKSATLPDTGTATIYAYQDVVLTDNVKTQNGAIVLPNSTNAEKTITFSDSKILAGTIFVVDKNNGDTFVLKSGATTIAPLSSSNTKLYYYLDTDATSVSVIYKNATTNTTITISPMYSCVKNENINDSAYGKITKKMQELDQDNQFNYMYTVPTESRIDNPLLGSSFMNVNHPYNQFTICQLSTDGTSIDIFGKLNAR